jgi:hypothetical protein
VIVPSFPLLIVSGLTAYVVSSWLLIFLRVIGATRYVPRVYWACVAFGGLTGAAAFGGRVLRAICMIALIPLLYAVFFELTGNADLKIGGLLGMVHAAVVGLILPLVGATAKCRRAPVPGLFGWRLGAATPFLLLLVYALYGATLGYVYVVTQ